MSQGGGGNQQDTDGEFLKVGIFMLIAAFVLVAFLARHVDKLNAFIGAVTWLHIYPFAMLVKLVPGLMSIPLIGPWLFTMAAAGHDFLVGGGFAEMTSENRWALLTAGGRCAVILYGGFFAWVAFRGQEFRVDTKYRSMHNIESMVFIQSEIWPTSRLARSINPLKGKEIDSRRLAGEVAKKVGAMAVMPGAVPAQVVAIRPGTWSRGMRPEELILANGITFDPERHKIISDPDAHYPGVEFDFRKKWETLNLETVSEVLSEQLREPWKGPMALCPSHRALYAVIALFYGYDVDGGNKLLNDLGVVGGIAGGRPGSMDAAIVAEKGLLQRIDGICKGENGRKLAKIAARHAYVETAMPAMLAAGRKDRGVLPAAAFLWLKSADRLMWYILNSVGNDAIMIEAAGALAHSKAEIQIGKPLRRPAVYQASRALIEDYLDMTEARIRTRAEKEVRGRSTGTKIDLLARDILARIRDGNDEGEMA